MAAVHKPEGPVVTNGGVSRIIQTNSVIILEVGDDCLKHHYLTHMSIR